MQVKKEVIESVQKNLQDELRKIQVKIQSNKYEVKKLAEVQSSLKRQRKVYCDLIWSLDQEKKGSSK
jgi:hypothetical protein